MPSMHLGSETEHSLHRQQKDDSWRCRQLAVVGTAGVLLRATVAQVLQDSSHGCWLVFGEDRVLTKSEVAAISIASVLGETFGPRAEAVDFATEVDHLGVSGLLSLAHQQRDLRNLEALRVASGHAAVLLAGGLVADVLNRLTDRGLFQITFDNVLIDENLAPWVCAMFGNPAKVRYRLGTIPGHH